jgi:hypothetical protein
MNSGNCALLANAGTRPKITHTKKRIIFSLFVFINSSSPASFLNNKFFNDDVEEKLN